MSINRLFIKFAITYFLLYFSLVVIVVTLEIGMGGEAITIGSLMGTLFLTCNKFGAINGRYFDAKEKKRVVVGFLIILILFQISIDLIALIAENDGVPPIDSLAFLYLIKIVGYAVVIYIFVGMIGKNFAKNDK